MTVLSTERVMSHTPVSGDVRNNRAKKYSRKNTIGFIANTHKQCDYIKVLIRGPFLF
jgi:hypothetical protein